MGVSGRSSALRGALAGAVLSALAWTVWALLTPTELPDSPVWRAMHTSERTYCFDCPHYVLAGKTVGHPLAVFHPSNALAWLNAAPLRFAVAPERRNRFEPTEVQPFRLLALSTLQWACVGAFLPGILRFLKRTPVARA